MQYKKQERYALTKPCYPPPCFDKNIANANPANIINTIETHRKAVGSIIAIPINIITAIITPTSHL